MFVVAAGDRDARTERSQSPRDRQADAGSTAGDHRDAILEELSLEHDPLIIG
jgi:hypothetical protein